jgi:hypothetical protein
VKRPALVNLMEESLKGTEAEVKLPIADKARRGSPGSPLGGERRGAHVGLLEGNMLLVDPVTVAAVRTHVSLVTERRDAKESARRGSIDTVDDSSAVRAEELDEGRHLVGELEETTNLEGKAADRGRKANLDGHSELSIIGSEVGAQLSSADVEGSVALDLDEARDGGIDLRAPDSARGVVGADLVTAVAEASRSAPTARGDGVARASVGVLQASVGGGSRADGERRASTDGKRVEDRHRDVRSVIRDSKEAINASGGRDGYLSAKVTSGDLVEDNTSRARGSKVPREGASASGGVPAVGVGGIILDEDGSASDGSAVSSEELERDGELARVGTVSRVDDDTKAIDGIVAGVKSAGADRIGRHNLSVHKEGGSLGRGDWVSNSGGLGSGVVGVEGVDTVVLVELRYDELGGLIILTLLATDFLAAVIATKASLASASTGLDVASALAGARAPLGAASSLVALVGSVASSVWCGVSCLEDLKRLKTVVPSALDRGHSSGGIEGSSAGGVYKARAAVLS